MRIIERPRRLVVCRGLRCVVIAVVLPSCSAPLGAPRCPALRGTRSSPGAPTARGGLPTSKPGL